MIPSAMTERGEAYEQRTSMADSDVFADVVGHESVVAELRSAVAASTTVGEKANNDSAMTHAWLFTGPAGSGRSVAARAFAAALQCPDGGCGQCTACHTTLAGTHADVRIVVPQGLTVGVSEMRELVLRAAGAPSVGQWQIVLIEDADRLTEAAGNALLKAIEEPAAHTVFLLCAPSTHPDDVPVTIRSRCRVVSLVTPSGSDVASVLSHRDGVATDIAQWAAQASQGHIGRARRLATDSDAAARRQAVLAIPRSLSNVGACFTAADALLQGAEAEARAETEASNASEVEQLAQALGAGGTGKGAAAANRGVASATKELAKRQKSRLTRVRRDALDRALVDLGAFYRDALVVRLGAPSVLVHPDMAEVSGAAAAKWTPESIVARIQAVLSCQEAIASNVKPKIALEALMLSLR